MASQSLNLTLGAIPTPYKMLSSPPTTGGRLFHPPPTPRRTTGRPLLTVALAATGPSRQRGRRGPPPGPSEQSDWGTEDDEGAPLRGLDVLQALRRAAAKKGGGGGGARKGKKRVPLARGEQKIVDYDDVRPIQIGSDWEGRIDELERKVEELRAQYHY